MQCGRARRTAHFGKLIQRPQPRPRCASLLWGSKQTGCNHGAQALYNLPQPWPLTARAPRSSSTKLANSFPRDAHDLPAVIADHHASGAHVGLLLFRLCVSCLFLVRDQVFRITLGDRQLVCKAPRNVGNYQLLAVIEAKQVRLCCLRLLQDAVLVLRPL